MDWLRKRHPEDVPTPVAVALSDFCRRAKSPASPGLVRDALALLTAADDERVRKLADTEPEGKIGPFGVVDLLSGTRLAVAVKRQADGFYDDVRKKAEESAVPERLEPAEEVTAPVKVPAPRASAPKKDAPRKRQTMREKIAPKRRDQMPPETRVKPQQPLPGTAFLPKRNLPLPRGRFTTVDPTRANLETLFREEGKATIVTLIEQVPHRVALLRALEPGYQGRRGSPLSIGDIEDLLEEHDLFEVIEKKERDGVLVAVLEQKGALGKAAWGFGLKTGELEQLIGALKLDREVDEIRKRFVKEALDPRNLALRLELLFRTKYLEDLRIDRKFAASLTRDLQALIDEVRDAATNIPTLVDMLSRQHAVHAESLERALQELGLLKPWLR